MIPREFLLSVAIVVAMLALASLIERILPLFARSPAHQERRRTNLGLTAVTISLNGALNAAASALALVLALDGPGLLTRLGVPWGVQLVGGFIVLDFSFGYLAHRMLHASPALWRVHRVHHSDSFVDVTTALRNHPIEGLWRFLFLLIPTWVLGIPAEAVALQRLLTVINGSLEHANIRLWPPLDRALSRFWVTPNTHKIHHSRAPAETDTNYGNILSIYDRLFGTFTPSDRAPSVRYGLDDVDPAQTRTLGQLLAMPFSETARREVEGRA